MPLNSLLSGKRKYYVIAIPLTIILLLLIPAFLLPRINYHDGGVAAFAKHFWASQQVYHHENRHYATIEELDSQESGFLNKKAIWCDSIDVLWEFNLDDNGQNWHARFTPLRYYPNWQKWWRARDLDFWIPETKGTCSFSYYIDETGILRGADLGGQPADANTPVFKSHIWGFWQSLPFNSY